MRGHPGAAALLQDLLDRPDPVGISAITVMQLYHGVSRAAVPEAEAERIEQTRVVSFEVTAVVKL